MKDETIRIALIGCGNMGHYYAYNISRMEDVSIVICCDPSRTKLEKYQEKWNIPAGTTDWKDLFHDEEERKNIDGVVNCTSDKLHGDIFDACTRRGIALLTEKPFAVPFEMINRLAVRHLLELKFVINFSKRVIPAVYNARKAISDNLLGKIHRMELHYRQGWVLNHDYGDWHTTSAWFWRLTNEYSQYGVLGDLGSHLFDLAFYFCGSVETVSCALSRIDKGSNIYRDKALDSMDDAQCFLKMHNGAGVLVNACRTAPGEKDGLEILICGDKGSIRILPEESKNSFQLFLIESGVWKTVSCPEKRPGNLQSFIDLMKNRDLSDYPGISDSLYNHAIIEAAAISAAEGCRIDVNEFGEKNLGEIWQKINAHN